MFYCIRKIAGDVQTVLVTLAAEEGGVLRRDAATLLSGEELVVALLQMAVLLRPDRVKRVGAADVVVRLAHVTLDRCSGCETRVTNVQSCLDKTTTQKTVTCYQD